jgi:hypothetical protein
LAVCAFVCFFYAPLVQESLVLQDRPAPEGVALALSLSAWVRGCWFVLPVLALVLLPAHFAWAGRTLRRLWVFDLLAAGLLTAASLAMILAFQAAAPTDAGPPIEIPGAKKIATPIQVP